MQFVLNPEAKNNMLSWIVNYEMSSWIMNTSVVQHFFNNTHLSDLGQ